MNAVPKCIANSVKSLQGEHLVENSYKLRVLDKLLDKAKAESNRVLIFSQVRATVSLSCNRVLILQPRFYRHPDKGARALIFSQNVLQAAHAQQAARQGQNGE